MVTIPDRIGVVLVGTDGVPYEIGASSGGVSQQDNTAFTAGTDSGTPVEGIYEATPSTITDGRVGVVGITANRVLKAALHDAAGAAITTLPVSLASVPSHAVTNAGTFAVQAAGDVAHDSPDSGGGAPVKIGGYAASSASAPTAVAAGDRVNAWYGLNGQAIVGYGSSGTGGDGVNGGFFTDAAGTARPVVVGVWNGTAYDRLRGTLADGLTVNLGANNDVTVASLPLPTGASTLAEQQTQTTALQLIDDASVVLGTATYTEASSSGRAIAAVRRDADTTLVNTTNEWGPLQMDANGRLKVEAFSGETLPVSLASLPALAAGTNGIGKLTANSGVDIGDVDVTSIAAGTNLIGDVGIQPRTSGGLTTFMASGSDGSSILVATAQAVKASAGQLYGYYVYNPEAAVTFLHWYNTAAASVTVGTTNPMMSFAIPAGAAANLSFPAGVVFSNAGWSVAATTTAGGNTAPATGLSLVAWYK